jgi:hypothetical protein
MPVVSRSFNRFYQTTLQHLRHRARRMVYLTPIRQRTVRGSLFSLLGNKVDRLEVH